MSWFARLFREQSDEVVILVDVGAGSVAGAYARFVARTEPSLIYSKRIAIEPHEGEERELAMERALGELGAALIGEGAPAALRAAGRGRADYILVSVSAPWESTALRDETFEKEKPFTFTRKMVRDALEHAAEVPDGKLLVDESIIGTILNGYATSQPNGKLAKRAIVIVLASLIDEPVARRVAFALRALFHHEKILSIAGSSLRYQALRSTFPHEEDALILDASGPEIAVSLVRGGLLVAVTEMPDGEAGSPEWIKEVQTALAELAKRYPLPRTIFLLADPGKGDGLARLLVAPEFDALWLSDEPPRVLTVAATQVQGIGNRSGNEPDLALMLMARYWRDHGHDD